MNLIWLIKIVIFPFLIILGIGLSDWSDKTPYGNEINNFMGSKILYLKNGQEIENVSQWYFYKEHIIGKTNSNDYNHSESTPHVESFFIVNDKSLSIKIFHLKSEWDTFITNNKLKPKFWTRWHYGKWNTMEDLVFILILGFIITIPLMILLGRSIYLSITKEKFNYKMRHTRVSILSTISCLIIVLLNSVPYSI